MLGDCKLLYCPLYPCKIERSIVHKIPRIWKTIWCVCLFTCLIIVLFTLSPQAWRGEPLLITIQSSSLKICSILSRLLQSSSSGSSLIGLQVFAKFKLLCMYPFLIRKKEKEEEDDFTNVLLLIIFYILPYFFETIYFILFWNAPYTLKFLFSLLGFYLFVVWFIKRQVQL